MYNYSKTLKKNTKEKKICILYIEFLLTYTSVYTSYNIINSRIGYTWRFEFQITILHFKLNMTVSNAQLGEMYSKYSLCKRLCEHICYLCLRGSENCFYETY